MGPVDTLFNRGGREVDDGFREELLDAARAGRAWRVNRLGGETGIDVLVWVAALCAKRGLQPEETERAVRTAQRGRRLGAVFAAVVIPPCLAGSALLYIHGYGGQLIGAIAVAVGFYMIGLRTRRSNRAKLP